MPSARITPWETPEDLIELGECFYQGGRIHGDNEILEHGCDLADAYSRRGPLPHAVASTAGLARALVAERRLDNSTTAAHAIAAMYATAFLAFVTGYLDNQQTGATKRTMFDLAASIGMPVSFVALRHAIVHEGYLGLRELRRVAREGLEWLWWNYWRSLLERPLHEEGSESEGEEDDANGDRALETATDKILADHVAAWAAQPPPPSHIPRSSARSNDAQLNGTAAATATAMVHVKGDRSARRHAAAIVEILLREDAMLAPFNGMKGEKHLIAKWDPLLRCLASQLKRRFVPAMIKGLLARLLQPSPQESHLKAHAKTTKKSKSGENMRVQISENMANSILAWMRHICNNIIWTRILRAEITLDELAASTLEHSSPYTTVVAVVLVRSRLWTASRRHSLEINKVHLGKVQDTMAEFLQALVQNLTKDTTPTSADEGESTQSKLKSQSPDLLETDDNEIDMPDDQADRSKD